MERHRDARSRGRHRLDAGRLQDEFGGTSAATPLAAGIAALMLSVNPTLTEAEIRNIMHDTCEKIGGVTYIAGTHPDTATGA